jgi:hypothetical protein
MRRTNASAHSTIAALIFTIFTTSTAQTGRKTMEFEILKEALDLAPVKKPTLLSRSQFPEDTP